MPLLSKFRSGASMNPKKGEAVPLRDLVTLSIHGESQATEGAIQRSKEMHEELNARGVRADSRRL